MRNGLVYVLIAMVVVCFTISAFAYKHVNEQADHNTATLEYVCETTTALDTLVKVSIDSTTRLFENGTYARLVKQGVLSQDEVDITAKQLETFREQHLLLLERGRRCMT